MRQLNRNDAETNWDAVVEGWSLTLGQQRNFEEWLLTYKDIHIEDFDDLAWDDAERIAQEWADD